MNAKAAEANKYSVMKFRAFKIKGSPQPLPNNGQALVFECSKKKF